MNKHSAITRILVLLLAVSMLVCMTACGADTATEPTETKAATQQPAGNVQAAASDFAGGTGTQDDPFQISEAGHLVLLHEMLKKEESETAFDKTYVEGHYVLTADILLNDTSDFDTWSTHAPAYNWEPIGAGLSLNSFSGVLDGNGHTISGIYINTVSADTDEAFGLFANMNGTIRNLTLDKAYIQVQGSSANVGVLAGCDRLEGVIENCHIQATVKFSGSGNVGGLMGSASDRTQIRGCTFAGSITQTGEEFSHMGGIAGSGGAISGCTSEGTLTGCGYTGGIVGYASIATDCTNLGDVTGNTAGGIAGRLYAAGTGLQIETPELGVENCTNNGRVTGTSMAGGMIGWMGNDEADISMYVENCQNNGQIFCDELAAGIVGTISVERSGLMQIAGCVNNVNISGNGTTGGIVGTLNGGILHQSGSAVISDCKNVGDMISGNLYSGGILASFLIMGEQVDLQLVLENCTNEGRVESISCAGGILGWSNVGFNASVSAASMGFSEATGAVLTSCRNSGAVTTRSSNSFAGGIVGLLGLGNIPTQIANCTNSGPVAVDFALTDAQITEMQGANWPEFYQIAGGIVGRIGDGLKLSTEESEKQDPANVNSSSPMIRIEKCSSTGGITAPDYSAILNANGNPLYVNYLGGILGQCSATEAYAFQTENCTYSGAACGLGDDAFADIGTKN